MATLSMSELRRLADAAEARDGDRIRDDLIDLLANHELLDVMTREYLREILAGSYRRFSAQAGVGAS